MSDIDPDLAPAEWDLANSNGAAASSSACADLPRQPPPPPAAVTMLLDQVFPDEHCRTKVMNWPISLVQQMHVWCRERLDGVVDGSIPLG